MLVASKAILAFLGTLLEKSRYPSSSMENENVSTTEPSIGDSMVATLVLPPKSTPTTGVTLPATTTVLMSFALRL